ncbi:MAG: hypothetical protein IJY61_04935 [Candidatus Gastranaerophilales bacterium]|nr:hypothetical protein [Candidatus Gastranaerophilales bacterium]
MINSINSFGGQTQQVRQNPDEYAKVYAEQNGISVEEAKAELKSKYGDPQAQSEISSIGSFGGYNNRETQDISSIQSEISDLEAKLFGGQTDSNNSFLSSIMNFFRGNEGSNQEMNMQNLINPETGTMTGPQKEGDPQFHLHPTTGLESGPQQEGDFQHPNQEDKRYLNMFQ